MWPLQYCVVDDEVVVRVAVDVVEPVERVVVVELVVLLHDWHRTGQSANVRAATVAETAVVALHCARSKIRHCAGSARP